MPKRNMYSARFESMRSLVTISNENDWNQEQISQELEKLIDKNADLFKDYAKNTLRSNFWTMYHVHRKVPLSKIGALVQKVMDAQPPGTRKRFYHEFMTICSHVRKTGHLP